MKYNKLIRDKIIENWDSKYGESPKTHVADEKEFYQKLKEKLLEETQEFIETDEEEELADIQEIINTICENKNITKEHLDALTKQKAEKNGAFKKRLILESSED